MLLKNAKSEFPHLAREDTFIFHLPRLKLGFSLLMKVFLIYACTLCHLNQSAVIQDCQHFRLLLYIPAIIHLSPNPSQKQAERNLLFKLWKTFNTDVCTAAISLISLVVYTPLIHHCNKPKMKC